MDLYREQLLDHYKHPRGWGLTSAFTGQHQLFNQQCGDEVTVQVDVADGLVTGMRFEGHGCVISRASASLLSQFITNKTIDQCLAVSLPEVEQLLGTQLPPNRVKCGMLAVDALHLAVQEIHVNHN